MYSNYMVLKDRLERGYYIGRLLRQDNGVWVSFHNYDMEDPKVCLCTLYPTFSEALEAMMRGEY